LAGNLPVAFFEKISLPSLTISKAPPPDSINVAVILYFFLIAPARLTACG
jgi:hypothetical protein